MAKYCFNELPDFIRDNLYSADGWQYAIRREWDMPIRDIVYVVIRNTEIGFGSGVIEESNYNSILEDFNDKVHEFGYYGTGKALAIPLMTTRKGKLIIPDDGPESELIEIAEELYGGCPIYNDADYSELADKLRTELFRQEVRYISQSVLGQWYRDISDEFCDELLAKLDNWHGTVEFTGDGLDYSARDKRVIECELITAREGMYN